MLYINCISIKKKNCDRVLFFTIEENLMIMYNAVEYLGK